MSLKDDWPSEPSPEYQERAMAMLQDEMARRAENTQPLPKVQTELERREARALFILDSSTETMHVVTDTGSIPTPYKREESTMIEVDVNSSDPVKTVLDPNDPFEAALIDIVTMNRRKRADYAVDGDPFSQFREIAQLMGGDFTGADVVHLNVLQKLTRLTALRSNGRMNDPANESVTDTRLDLAVYAIIAYAIHRSGT